MKSWVPHIMAFIVPRQIVTLGNPANRAADSCESLGARIKKLIKHLSCRRLARSDTTGAPLEHAHTSTRDGKKKAWTQVLTKGYIQQVFSRVCVGASSLYGPENKPYLQRADALLLAAGRIGKRRDEPKPNPLRNIRARMEREMEREMNNN